jgi:hypothetical protein
MLNLVSKFDRYETKIKDYILDRISTYRGSNTFKRLKSHIQRLEDSIDMRFHTVRTGSRALNEWQSKVCMPLVREKYLLLKALGIASFRNDPLLTLTPDGDVTFQQAEDAQEVLQQNFRRTEFRQKAFRRIVQYASRCGAAVVIQHFKATERRFRKTMQGTFGIEQQQMTERRFNCWNKVVHPLNYFTNHDIADMDEADFNAWMERVSLAEIIADFKANPDGYIKDNLKKVIDESKKGTQTDDKYFSKGFVPDWQRVGIDELNWYGRINIIGNEEDDTIYYVKMIGENIVKIEENQNDENIVPISIFTFDPRLEYWWGNTPPSNSLPFENYLNLMMNIRADSAIRSLENYVFVNSQLGLDMADINNRKKPGGFISYDGKGVVDARTAFFQAQFPDISPNSIEPTIREIKEADQRVSLGVDMLRPAAEGGPQNKTLGAAIMQDEQGNILKSDVLEQFSYGMIRTGRNNLTLLQQHLPNIFDIQDRQGQRREIMKGDILGTYQYRVDSSLTKNRIVAATNLLNFMTFVQNMKGTGDPSWQNIQWRPIIKKWLGSIDLDIDTEEINPEAQPQMAVMPGMGAGPGMGNGMGLRPQLGLERGGPPLLPQPAMEPGVVSAAA